MKVLVVMPFKDKHKVLMAQNFPQVEFIYERNPERTSGKCGGNYWQC